MSNMRLSSTITQALRFSALYVVHLMFWIGACERVPDPEFDPAMPAPGKNIVSLHGAERARVLGMSNPIRLTFNSDQKYFHGANDAAILSDGSVAIANQQSGEIFLFDAAGQFIRAIGRTGSGPGEFQDLTNVIVLEGDTIVAFDSRNRTVSYFTRTGDFVKGYRVEGPQEALQSGAATLEGRLGSRAFLIRTYAVPTPDVINQAPNQVVQAPVVVFITDFTGRAPEVIGQFPGNDQWFSDASGVEATYGAAPFGRRTWFGVMNGKIAVLRNAEPGFRVLLHNGEHYASYRGDMRTRKVTGRDRDEFMKGWFTSLRGAPYWKKLESLLRSRGFPAKMPYYRDAIVGTDGIVWLEPYEAWRPGERTYVGYDSTGMAVGKLRFPNDGRLLEIGAGVAVVLSIEELGIPNVYIQRYQID